MKPAVRILDLGMLGFKGLKKTLAAVENNEVIELDYVIMF